MVNKLRTKPLVTMDRWGKDHWSTFAYAETRTVDYDGYLDMRHMRMDGTKYPTRLKGEELPDHTDLDCLFDAQDLRLLTIERATQRTAKGDIKQLTYHVEMTDRGKQVAAQLRDHIAARRNYAEFEVA